MRVRAAISACVILLALLTTARAATVQQLGSQDGIGIIGVTGEIGFGDDQRFIDLALPLTNAIVLLAGPGGNLETALAIGRAIRLKRFSTVVPNGFECASACGLIWLAGQTRYLTPSSRVGFHAAYDLTEGVARERGFANAVVGAYLGSLGLSQQAIIYLTMSPPDAMQWMTLADAARVGIDVRSLDLSAPSASAVPNRVQTAGPSSPSARVPKFKDYPAGTAPVAKRAPVDLSTAAARQFRTRLRAASRQQPNFAGHYVLASWGCGAPCAMGAVVDLASGAVTFLPGSVCCWSGVDASFNPIEFRKTSRLIVMSGRINEAGPMGAHFYEFTGNAFREVATVPMASDFRSSQR